MALQWTPMEMENVNMQGFEDGCMFELEEIQGDAYQVIHDETTGSKTIM